MKIIKCLSEYIHEELDDAKKYAEKALQIKQEYPEAADLMYQLSQEEMTHMNRLHVEAEKIIAEYRKTEGEPPAPMMAVYDYLHEQAIAKAKEVKIMQNMYREG